MAPVRGPFSTSSHPAVMSLDDYRSVAITVIPAAVQPAVMFVELGTRSAIIVTVAIVMVSIAADAETKALGARHRRRCNRDGR